MTSDWAVKKRLDQQTRVLSPVVLSRAEQSPRFSEGPHGSNAARV